MLTANQKKILVIDDDLSILELVKVNLEIEGFKVVVAEDAIQGIALSNQEKPSMIILDIMLPGLDGYTACQQIRAANNLVPILMLTAMSRSEAVVTGFEAGTDDYLVKPFDLGELVARVRSLLRRAEITSSVRPQSAEEINSMEVAKSPEILHAGELTLMPESREAKVGERVVHLTPIEFEILYCLMQNLGKTVSPNTLLHDIWGYSPDDDIETIRVHIRHLRQRLEPRSSSRDSGKSSRDKKYIKTIYGKGYQLVAEGYLND